VTPVEVAPVELKLAPDTELEIMLEAELGLILNVELVLVRRCLTGAYNQIQL
jgi:hypothetical protein